MLEALFRRLNPSDEEIELMKKELDLDGSGAIEFKEFLTLMNSKTLRYILISVNKKNLKKFLMSF